MPLLPRDLIDAEDVQGLHLPQLQPFFHHPFHERGNHFPIQSEIFCHFLEGELFRQQCNGLSQALGDPFPSSCPRHALHSQSTSRAENPKGTVDDPKYFIPDREIPPTPLWTSPPSHLRFPPTMATPQTTIPQSIYSCNPSFFGLHDLGHPMGFHSQAFSDISFHTHRPLTSFLLTLQGNKRSSIRVPDAFPVLDEPIFHDHFLETNRYYLQVSERGCWAICKIL